MTEKEWIIAEINRIKYRNMPKRDVRHLLNRLAELDDPFSQHVNTGTESTGRRHYRTQGRIPFDKMDDESKP